MSKTILRLFLLLLAVWGTARFCHYQTKGFRLCKLQENTTCLPQISPPFPRELLPVFHQKFHFFNRGLQSFSFLSEDKTTVLKLFNNRYQNRLRWLRFFPSKEKILQSKEKWKKAFTSYQIAFDILQKESGFLYFHPAKSGHSLPITLIDPLGIEHKLDLCNHAFALQKRATLTYSYFASCAEEKNLDKATKAFHSLFSLLQEKMNRGIRDDDPLIRTNFGFHEDQAMQIDLGSLSFDETMRAPENQRKELEKMILPLKHWLEAHHPELLPLFYDALQSL